MAFANLRRLYVAPRVNQLDVPSEPFGVPPDTHEVHVADDMYDTPNYMDLQFSHDSKYLLLATIVVVLVLGQQRATGVTQNEVPGIV